MSTERRPMGVDEVCHPQRAMWGLLLATAAVYLASMPLSFVTHDAADELAFLVAEETVYRSNHLLLTCVYKLALAAARGGGFDGPPFFPAQLVNVGAGVLSVGLAFRMSWSITKSTSWSLLLGTAVATSFLWFHSSTLETGAIATSLLFCALFVGWRNRRTASVGSTFVTWGCLCCSVLFAFNQILLLPAFAWALCFGIAREHTQRVKHVGVAAGAALLFLALPVIWAGWSNGASGVTGIVRWLASHSDQQRLSDVGFGPAGLLRSFSGFMRLWFATDSGPTLVKAAMTGVELRDGGGGAWLGLGIGLAMSVMILVVSARSLSGEGLYPSENRVWLQVSAGAWLTIFVFGGCWLGSDPQFWLPALPFVTLMMAIGVQRFRERHAAFEPVGGMVACLACLVMVWGNAPRETPSAMFPQGGRSFQSAQQLARELSTGDLLLTPGAGWAIYVRHYVKEMSVVNLAYADSLGAGDTFLDNLAQVLQKTWQSGGQVYFDGLQGPLLPSQLGYWKMVENARGVTRDELAAYLAEHAVTELDEYKGVYRVVPSGESIARMTRRD